MAEAKIKHDVVVILKLNQEEARFLMGMCQNNPMDDNSPFYANIFKALESAGMCLNPTIERV